MGLFDSIRAFLARHKGRVGRPLVLVLALLALVPLWKAAPRTTALAVSLGPDHAEVRRARLEVLDGDDTVRVVDLRFGGEGAPATLREDVELSPGEYRLALDLRLDDGRWERRVGQVEAPAEGVVRVAMREEPGR